MARRRYSYLARKEEKQNLRKAYLFVVLSIVGVVAIIIFGIPVLAKFAGFLGNLNQSGQPVEVNDTTPPITPRLDILPEATNKKKLEVKGNTESGATVKIDFNGDEVEIIADSNGQFSTFFELSGGKNSLSATAVDNAGNESSETPTYSIVYDNSPPSLELTSPESGAQFYGSKQRQVIIEGKTEPDADVRINDRIVVVEDDGSFSYATTLSEGENKFNVRSEDSAGNSTEESLTLNYTP